MPEYDLTKARWHKSSHSGGNGGEDCVEVASQVPGVIPVRDSKLAADRPLLLIPTPAWDAFLTSLR